MLLVIDFRHMSQHIKNQPLAEGNIGLLFHGNPKKGKYDCQLLNNHIKENNEQIKTDS